MILNALRFIRPLPWPDGAVKPPQLQAHRGLWTAGFPENTIPAFRAAKAAGFKMCELDVQLTADGEALVFHDDDLLRMAGESKLVREMTAAEIRKRFNAPTLREVLSDAQGTDYYNVEIKAPRATAGKIEPIVAKVVAETNASKRIMFSSFNPFAVALISELCPDIPRALLASPEKEDDNIIVLRRLWLAPFLRIHALNLDQKYLDPETVSYLKSKNMPYAVWTVDDQARAETLLESGAMSIISNRLRP